MRLLVTGGSGSFGTAFVRDALTWPETERIVVYSRDEHKQQRALATLGPDAEDRLRFFLGDVRDAPRLAAAMRGITHVVHAAALKVVPWLEYNPGEGVKTNILGAMNVIDAASHAGARVVAISTDKAVGPVNLYGATKLAAEKLFLASGGTVVRYGNVTGSAGSVVPLWRPMARAGTPLPLTDERMTRYWMRLRDAVGLVRSVLDMPGGRVVVPKLASYYVRDLATAVWREQGEQGRNAPTPIIQVGIRPGEKLHESLVGAEERQVYDCGAHFEVVPVTSDGPGGRAQQPIVRGQAVPECFHYSSEVNDQWLTADMLQSLLADL